MKKEFLKQNKGITLIALVITIIVLLILAGVAISMLSGENGILKKAAEAKEKTEAAQKQEETTLTDYELISHFTLNNSKYKCNHGYITGITPGEDVSALKKELPNGYKIYDEDEKTELTTGVITTGMKVKKATQTNKANNEIGRIIVVGDLDGSGDIRSADRGKLNYIIKNGIELAIKQHDYKEYNFVAADINADGILNWIDFELLTTYMKLDNELAISQNVNAKKFEKIVNYNTSRKEYVGDISNAILKAKFEWQEGSDTKDGYYNYSAKSTDTVQAILEVLPNKKTVILRGEDKLNSTDPVLAGDVIMLVEEIRGVEVLLDIAKITIQ